ncbi:MAG TPA: hypothetical protein VLA19_17920 [Herpetosiphonaceae bacterium]|nr:hypothetical protein [Herpetosiphonaceae bacterium]
MRWPKPIFERRGDSNHVDRAGLAIWVTGALVFSFVVRELTSPGWFYAILLPLAVGLVAADIWVARRRRS